MSMMNKLVGRERECQELKRVMESDRSEFVIVYGRRRVGKTFLVDQYYQGHYDFTFVGGHNLSRQRQLASFARALKKYSGVKPDKFADWFDAFDALEDLHLRQCALCIPTASNAPWAFPVWLQKFLHGARRQARDRKAARLIW